MNIYAVVMAGGAGTRFWPLSRTNCPKQFLNIIGPKTMIEQTLERIKPLCREEQIIIVGNEEQSIIQKELLGETRLVLLEEPHGRNTAPAIGLAAIYLRKKGIADSPMVVLPADHFINNEEEFRNILLTGCALAKEGSIVTIGIIPTRPETGYGYIRRGSVFNKIDNDKIKVYTVKKFVEKPNQKDALHYLKSGKYFWNSGIFIFTPDTILKEIEHHMPDIYKGLLKIENAMGQDHYSDVLRSVYQELPSVSIDYGVMEKTSSPVLTIPGDFGWSDVGSWESLYNLRQEEMDNEKNLVQGNNLLLDSNSTFVFNQSTQTVVGLGLKDLVIVNVDDVILVADIKKSQDIKKVIEKIKAKGLHSIL